MSGVVAIYHRDGRPVNLSLLEHMVQAMAHRGPDGMTKWANGPVGLGHCLMQTTPESLREHQPVCDERERYWLIWDGRLDNRDEVLAALKSEGILYGAETDPELVLGAYQLWGTRCAQRILGEFAFVVWDQQTRTLFGARDRLGLKPFYYASQGQTVLIASEAKSILKLLDRMPDPDDELILAMLLSECREQDQSRSLFAGINRLPPGHTLQITKEALRVERYWCIDPEKQLVYRRPEEYVERFRALFREVMQRQTRSAFPVACFLSGGLDSASFTMLAALPGARVEAFNVFADEPKTDERRYARGVCQAVDIPLWEFRSQPQNPLEGLADLLWKVESPLVGPYHDTQGFSRLVQSRGCRIVLHGDGADQLLDEFGYLADVLLRRGPVRFLRETSAFNQWFDSDAGPFGHAPHIALKAVLPTWLKYVGKRLLHMAPPPWINRQLAQSLGFQARLRKPRVPIRFPCLSQVLSYQEALGPYFTLKLELAERHAAWQHREIRYPYLDSRLVEFILSIPWHHRCHGGVRQWLLREAMRGIVPEPVRVRKGKGDWTKPMDQDLIPLCSGNPPEPLANRSGMVDRFVDLQGVQALVSRYREGIGRVRWDVWTCIALDHWLKRFWKEGGNHDVTDQASQQETVHLAEVAGVR